MLCEKRTKGRRWAGAMKGNPNITIRLMIPISPMTGFVFAIKEGIFAMSSKGAPSDPRPSVTGICLAMMMTPMLASKP